jgi:hypothetical protein
MLIRTLGSISVASALCAAASLQAQERPDGASPIRLAAIMGHLPVSTERLLGPRLISPTTLVGSPFARPKTLRNWLPLAQPLASAPLDAVDEQAWDAVERRLLTAVWTPVVPPLPQLVDLPLATFVVRASEETLFDIIDDAEPRIDARQRAQDPSGELEWLLRRKRRSVLEAIGNGPSGGPVSMSSPQGLGPPAPWAPDVSGTVEYSASPTLGQGQAGSDEPLRSSGGLLRFQGRLPNDGRWMVGAVMHEAEGRSWQGRTEVVAQLFDKHEIMATTSWGSRFLADQPDSGSAALEGALYLQDRWTLWPSLDLITSGRYSYVGYLHLPHYFDPGVSFAWTPRRATHVTLGARSRTLVPGGDSIALSAFVPAAGILVNSFTSGRLGRAMRGELNADHAWGSTEMGAHAFVEDVTDPSIYVLASAADPRPQGVMLGGHLHRYGVGCSVSERLSGLARVSLSYTLGRSLQIVGPTLVYAPGMPRASLPDGRYHDITANVETTIGLTHTRLVGFSRYVRHRGGSAFRYDVQLRQGVPYLPRHTGTDWTLILAVRNLFEEPRADDVLEQIVLVNPPRRLVGGVSVHF